MFEKNGIISNERQVEALNEFAILLLQWNKKVNLISRKDEDNILWKHVFGSLLLMSKINFEMQSRVIDVGTGGGFPGIPLAICLPELQFTLVDSIKKKINVVSDIITQLSLKNAVAICSRAESLSETREHKGRYDYVVARAVAPVNDIVRWSKNFLKINHKKGTENTKQKCVTNFEKGVIVIFKGGDITQEIRETEIKQKPKSIEIVPLVVNGMDTFDFTDKKIVLVRP
ncbi:MAG: 16S rRNA (guanine(527)-N(7))-methyltransferase RsmG [Ignavibacteriales bacterium]|nr:16S rRNA (guanine(527)-N(7))-methyltransferase RsmG [Ignavibacteriales bacterium]